MTEADKARELKRKVDHDLRGFAYFDSFEELNQWTEAKVDPLHKANTPLLRRPDIPASFHKTESSNVMVMHDYRGAYLESGYEACQGAIVSAKDYILEYWQQVETFNYFTHFRVSIPPPTWVNTGHRNGTLVLGTFCIEGGDQAKAKHILDKNKNGKYTLADILARMAACYGFDGWLMNVETDINVDDSVWDGGKALEAFLTQLRGGLKSLPSGGKVIW
jgi:endo-beta-N-acetylglucosaminidase D